MKNKVISSIAALVLASCGATSTQQTDESPESKLVISQYEHTLKEGTGPEYKKNTPTAFGSYEAGKTDAGKPYFAVVFDTQIDKKVKIYDLDFDGKIGLKDPICVTYFPRNASGYQACATRDTFTKCVPHLSYIFDDAEYLYRTALRSPQSILDHVEKINEIGEELVYYTDIPCKK